LLGTRQRERAVDDEERHALHPKPPGQCVSLLDGFPAVVAVPHGLGPVPVEAGPGDHVEERLTVADVPALREVGPEQRLHDRTLHALPPGQPNEPVVVEGVRGTLDAVEGKRDAFGLLDRNHPGVEFLRALPACELFRAVFPAGKRSRAEEDTRTGMHRMTGDSCRAILAALWT
jgi:hypothetical protein